jgi:hypothetical protein
MLQGLNQKQRYIILNPLKSFGLIGKELSTVSIVALLRCEGEQHKRPGDNEFNPISTFEF